jgi:hypothetical protein
MPATPPTLRSASPRASPQAPVLPLLVPSPTGLALGFDSAAGTDGDRVFPLPTGRLVVRRIPELNAFAGAGPPTLFDTYPVPRVLHDQ